MYSKLEEKATAEAIQELQQTRLTETIRHMINEEIQSKWATAEAATARWSTEEGDEIANEVMDIESKKNSIIIYKLEKDSQSPYLTQM